MDDADDIEYALLNKREVMIYQIPPASSSNGHKAEDWKACIWRGRCRIVGKGKDLSIKMLDSGTGELFAQCMIPNGQHEQYVERVTDSSRYFVLKITNGARHAFIGLGFEDRNDAFDFTCALSDFKTTWVDRDKSDTTEQSQNQEPSRDLSLKEGEKIKINIGGLGAKKRDAKPDAAAGGFEISSGFPAPPPPGSSSRRPLAPPPACSTSGEGTATGSVQAPPFTAVPAVKATAAAAAAFSVPDQTFNDFGDFGDFTSAPAAAPAPAQQYSSFSAGLFDHVGISPSSSSQINHLNLSANCGPVDPWPAVASAQLQPGPASAALLPGTSSMSGLTPGLLPNAPLVPKQSCSLTTYHINRRAAV